jgi:hypothetical protein
VLLRYLPFSRSRRPNELTHTPWKQDVQRRAPLLVIMTSFNPKIKSHASRQTSSSDPASSRLARLLARSNSPCIQRVHHPSREHHTDKHPHP